MLRASLGFPSVLECDPVDIELTLRKDAVDPGGCPIGHGDAVADPDVGHGAPAADGMDRSVVGKRLTGTGRAQDEEVLSTVVVGQPDFLAGREFVEIGRASCRERVCQYV